MLWLLTGGICDVNVEMTSCSIVYLPGSMKIGRGVQAILRFCHKNLRGCNFSILGGRDL
jgi:hypothetical protein